MIRNHADNKPDLEDYLEYLQTEHGTVFVTVEVWSPAFASGFVRHLEVYNRPPTFDFEDLDQKCFVANINGGDSAQFSTQASLMQYLEREFHTWLVDTDAVSMTVLDNIEQPPWDD